MTKIHYVYIQNGLTKSCKDSVWIHFTLSSLSIVKYVRRPMRPAAGMMRGLGLSWSGLMGRRVLLLQASKLPSGDAAVMCGLKRLARLAAFSEQSRGGEGRCLCFILPLSETSL